VSPAHERALARVAVLDAGGPCLPGWTDDPALAALERLGLVWGQGASLRLTARGRARVAKLPGGYFPPHGYTSSHLKR